MRIEDFTLNYTDLEIFDLFIGQYIETVLAILISVFLIYLLFYVFRGGINISCREVCKRLSKELDEKEDIALENAKELCETNNKISWDCVWCGTKRIPEDKFSCPNCGGNKV